ncbi:ATP-dependent helicase HrpB [Zavarzinia compransoris]|uniref:ATP-dependent helicase HrpB n=1 Tax=Zavarzinia marina TaxID=2911065 RepID=UPI001F1F3429|nr:ATP-dependent helicase HrpB [Zavarzinia marina]MCF4165177.1 ATP-dependent helicase HrpB [Zavarzinia marina]
MDPLPIDAVLPALAAALDGGTAAVLEAPTGAGKTTGVPLALRDRPWIAGGRIIMLEPRRLAARAAAGRMAALLGEAVGETVGYRVRFDSRIGPGTRIEVVTDGLFTRMIVDDPGLEGVAAVIFDEFHERSLDADLGLALALEAQEALRPDLRLLVMSATLDGERVAGLLGGAPVVRSEGRAFPVAVAYAERRDDDPVEARMARAIRRALTDHGGDILAFLPGRAEIERVAVRLEEGGLPPGVALHRLHGDLDLATQDRALAPAPAGGRKVVLSTNIAETSLTIEGVAVVIDSGLERVAAFDPGTGMGRLVTGTISAASAEQRRGRAGRLGPGTCIRLWTEAEQRALPAHAPPRIQRADMAPVALDLALWGVADPGQLRLLDAPNAGAFAQARGLLADLGALDGAGRITDHGRALARLGAHPRLGHLMIEGRRLGLGAMATRVAALIEGRDPVKRQPGRRDADLALRLDALAGDGGGIDRAQARQIAQAARQWARRLKIAEAPDDRARLGELVALAYPERVARRRPGGGGVYLMASGQGARLDPAEPLAGREWLAIASLDGQRRDGRVFLAAGLDETEVATLFGERMTVEERVDFDPDSGQVRARRRRLLGAITVEDAVWPDPPRARVTAALLQAVRDGGMALLGLSPAARALRARVAFLRGVEGEGWPDWSDGALLDGLAEWLGPYVEGISRLDGLRRLDFHEILAAALDWPRRQALDRLAPSHLSVPSGNRHALDYGDGRAPVLAVKLQEMFGARETPSVAGGRVPVTLHLLSPAGRPVQVTSDLAGFWDRGYRDVRADLRGRYPKHPWPEDPTTAPATAKTKRHLPPGTT